MKKGASEKTGGQKERPKWKSPWLVNYHKEKKIEEITSFHVAVTRGSNVQTKSQRVLAFARNDMVSFSLKGRGRENLSNVAVSKEYLGRGWIKILPR